LLHVQQTTATYVASEALTCQLCAVITLAHDTDMPEIMAFIFSVNALLSQQLSALQHIRQ
jgi:hypothetical protein